MAVNYCGICFITLAPGVFLSGEFFGPESVALRVQLLDRLLQTVDLEVNLTNFLRFKL
jgi:hypothetical protein